MKPRPKSGLLRVRQFIMKDSYSFDIDAAGLDVSYQKHYDAYCRIFDRCGLKYMVVEADSGAMGGSQSHEFMVRTPAGEDRIVSCEKCDYAANLEKATSKLAAVEDLKAEGDGKPLEVHTPGMKTIEDVAKFLGVSPKNKIKTLALMMEEPDPKTGKTSARAVVLLMRGDHQMNEVKLSSALWRQGNTPHAGGGNPGSCSILQPGSWDPSVSPGQRHEGRRTSRAVGGQSARRPHQPDRRSEQRGLSLEEPHAGPRFPAHRLC